MRTSVAVLTSAPRCPAPVKKQRRMRMKMQIEWNMVVGENP
jgi:hypothetical protein